MSYIDRDGISIYFESEGEGPALLLSHGYSSTGAMWNAQVEALRDTHHVITWDMRGHGRSDYPAAPEAYSERLTVEDMAAILDVCEVERATIGGLSLGGYMSLAFHHAFPERTAALLLFDTGPGYKSDDGRAEWNRTSIGRAERLESEGLAALSRSREVKARNHRSALGLAGAARGMLAQADDRIIQSLPGIDVPTLVVVGADDTPFLGASSYMAHKISGAHQVIIPDAGHASNLDQPAAFNATVEEFLAGLAAPVR